MLILYNKLFFYKLFILLFILLKCRCACYVESGRSFMLVFVITNTRWCVHVTCMCTLASLFIRKHSNKCVRILIFLYYRTKYMYVQISVRK